MRYLLLGNPNVGKSSLFNLLTNTYAHVGNHGGITVEAKLGRFPYGEIIDLPGTYSVSPSSQDEGVVTQALIKEQYNGMINIVDSTHLKRNLHLTIQLLELGAPMYIVANMIDELEKSGMKLDVDQLSNHLGCPVFSVSAKTKAGVSDLKQSIAKVEVREPLKLNYGQVIEEGITQIKHYLMANRIQVRRRWLAIQLLEGNEAVLDYIDLNKRDEIMAVIQQTEEKVIQENIALSLKGAIFNTRREYIEYVLNKCLSSSGEVNHAKYFNRKIDQVLTHPFYGLITFILVMYSMYALTFDFLGNIISDFIDGWISNDFGPFMVDLLTSFGVEQDGILMSLVVDGVIAGVGGVLVFVPQITILFFLLAVIEGTGYMSRVAMMLDTLLSKFGLNGKSIVPLVTGIGCNVPAVMSTRTIADKKERLLTILIIPFMSCSARIPIYGLLASIFFENHRGLVIISMYIIGTFVALVAAKALSLSIFKNTANNFMLEIPPYRIPSGRNVFRHTKLMVRDFVEKAGKFILLGTVMLWFLQYIGPSGVATSQDQSFLALIGKVIAPLLSPLGFGNWQSSSSLIVGFIAKELIYSSMIVIYGSHDVISHFFTPLSAYSFMLFSLLYLPCLPTVAVIKQETKSLKITLLALLFTFSVAYVITLIVYQSGSLLL